MEFFLVTFLFRPPVVVSNASCKYSLRTPALFCIVASPCCLTDFHPEQFLVPVLHLFLQLYFLIFRILNFCKVDFCRL